MIQVRKKNSNDPDWTKWEEVPLSASPKFIEQIFRLLLEEDARAVILNLGNEVHEYRFNERHTLSEAQRFARWLGMKLTLKIEEGQT